MKILMIACLPRRPSLGEAQALGLRRALEEGGHEVLWHELYEEGFDPLLSPAELDRGISLDSLVQLHAEELAEAPLLLIVHPDWWGGAPAILKGWVDRVFRQGIAYELAEGGGSDRAWKPLLGGKRAVVYVTSDSEEPGREALFRSLWVDSILGYCGMETKLSFIGNLRKSRSPDRQAWLEGALGLALGPEAMEGGKGA